MKRVLLAGLMMTLCFVLAGCGNANTSSSPQNTIQPDESADEHSFEYSFIKKELERIIGNTDGLKSKTIKESDDSIIAVVVYMKNISSAEFTALKLQLLNLTGVFSEIESTISEFRIDVVNQNDIEVFSCTNGTESNQNVPTPESGSPNDSPPAESVIFSGTGDDVVSLGEFSDIYVFHITGNQEGRHFAVKGYDASGNATELFVNTTDSYSGITIDPAQKTKTLEISATGDWAIEQRSIYTMRTISEGESVSGSGDEILMVLSFGQTATIEGNSGNRHFAVKSYGASRDDLLVNTTDAYSGNVLLKGDPIVLEVIAAGEWSITFS
jgi:hypothetical protein